MHMNKKPAIQRGARLVCHADPPLSTKVAFVYMTKAGNRAFSLMEITVAGLRWTCTSFPQLMRRASGRWAHLYHCKLLRLQ